MIKIKRFLGIVALATCGLFVFLNNASAAEMPNEFKELLSKDGYIEVDSIPPSTNDQAGLLIGDYVLSVRTEGRFNLAYNDENGISCNSDYTVCDIEHYESRQVYPIKIRYNYDKNIKKIVDEYAKKLESKSTFYVRDMEVVNFWINAKGKEDFT